MSENTKRKGHGAGLIWIIGGVVLMLSALVLIGYNYYDAYLADRDAQYFEQVLSENIEEYVESQEPTWELETEEDMRDWPMPTVLMGKDTYIGILNVPEYNLSLPVMEDWNYRRLRQAPCRYSGSYFAGNLVICGHNYPKHFSQLKWIPEGSEITFLTVDGVTYRYEVIKVETLRPTDVEQMITPEEGDQWDLTLFTCTTGGRARAAVRCRQTERVVPSYIIND